MRSAAAVPSFDRRRLDWGILEACSNRAANLMGDGIATLDADAYTYRRVDGVGCVLSHTSESAFALLYSIANVVQ